MARRKEPIYGLKLEDGQEILDKREIRVIKIIKDCCLKGMSLKDIFEKLDKELENLKDSSLNAYIDRPYLEKSQFDHIITNLTNMIREKEREEAYLNYRLLEENKLRRGDIDHYINELLNLDLTNKDRSAIILHMFIESIWAEDIWFSFKLLDYLFIFDINYSYLLLKSIFIYF